MLTPAGIEKLVLEHFLEKPSDLDGDYILTGTDIARTYKGVSSMSEVLLLELQKNAGASLNRHQKMAAANEFVRKIKGYGFKKLAEDNVVVNRSVNTEVWTIHGRGIGKCAAEGVRVVKYTRA